MRHVPYILLDNKIILQLSSGARTVTPTTVGYNKLRRSLPVTETEALEILATRDAPLFHAVNENNSITLYDWHRKFPKGPPFLGVYYSYTDAAEDFPELAL